jgi:hypothetical protein
LYFVVVDVRVVMPIANCRCQVVVELELVSIAYWMAKINQRYQVLVLGYGWYFSCCTSRDSGYHRYFHLLEP